MQVTVIAAEACKAADAHTAVSQVVSGELQAGFNDILPAGDPEKLLV